MKELSIQQCRDISGGDHVPDVGSLLINVALAALFGAMRGALGGPAGIVAGAVTGAVIAATGTIAHDAYQISKDHPN